MVREAGFTLVELLIVIVIVGILLSVAVVGQSSTLLVARDNERADDIASIARLLEDDYTNQTVGAPAYPYTTQFTTDITNKTGTANGVDKNIFNAPNATSSSVIAASTNSTTQTPSISQYVYQPLASDGSLCSSSSQTCVLFNLYYQKEATKTVISVTSAHQQ